MENNEVKRDNRRAMPKFLLIMLASAVFGGVLGFGTGWVGHNGMAETAAAAVDRVLWTITPWAIPVTTAVSLILMLWLYSSAKRRFAAWDGEDEEAMDKADVALNWGMLVTAVQLVVDFFFLAALSHYDYDIAGLLGALFFLISIAFVVVAQQKIVDLTRRMNPEKKGSVYDVHFHKTWLESCDEAEQRQIGQAAYKTYRTVNTTCLVLWVVLMALSWMADIGLLPAFMVMVIWGVQQVGYCLESIRLEKKKGERMR